jgi:coatomer subunit gamma
LQGDVHVAGKKILGLLNMKIISQDSTVIDAHDALGRYGDMPIAICVDFLYSSYCGCIADVYCDDEAVVSRQPSYSIEANGYS